MKYQTAEGDSHVQTIQIFAKVIEFSLESLLETKAIIFHGPADCQGSADHQKFCDSLRGISSRVPGTEGEWGATLKVTPKSVLSTVSPTTNRLAV